MRRFALSTIFLSPDPEIGWTSPVATFPCNWKIAVSPDHRDTTGKKWVLYVVAAAPETFPSMDTHADIDILPFGPENLSQSWLSIGTSAQRNTFANAIRARTGVPITRDDPRTLGEIMAEIGYAVDPRFDPAAFDIIDWGIL